MGRKNYLKLLGLSLAVAGLPLFVRGDYYLSILVFMGLNSLIVMGLSLLMGYAGQISLGHAAFYGIGAYCTGVLTTHFGLSIYLSFLGRDHFIDSGGHHRRHSGFAPQGALFGGSHTWESGRLFLLFSTSG